MSTPTRSAVVYGTRVSRRIVQPDAGIITQELPGQVTPDMDQTLDLGFAKDYIADIRARVLGHLHSV